MYHDFSHIGCLLSFVSKYTFLLKLKIRSEDQLIEQQVNKAEIIMQAILEQNLLPDW